MDPPQHALLYFLFGPQADIILPNLPERLQRWDAAFDQWLVGSQPVSRSRMSARYVAWRSFFQFSPMPPWEIQPSNLEAWIDHELNEMGRKGSTIARFLDDMRSFYRFVQAQGLESPPPDNPALRVPIPYRGPGSTAYSFSQAELAAFFGAIEHTVSILGKRSYAIVLLILYCGLSAREVRHMRWQDLTIDWESSTGSLARVNIMAQIRLDLPPHVLEALRDYLVSAGRLESMQATDIVLPPMILHYPGRQPDRPEDWRADRPIHDSSFEQLLKTIAAQAGLQADRVNSRVLRNTAIAIRLEMGDTMADLQRFSGLADLNSVYILRKRITSQPQNVLWKRKPGAEPASEARQGLYTQALPPEDLALLARIQPAGLQDEIDALRLTLMRTLRQAQEANPNEQIRLLDSYSAAASRLANLLKTQKELNETGDAFDARLEQALRQVQEQTGWELGISR
jgi:integrase